MTAYLAALLRTACTRPIMLAALKLALFVGCVLNFVNQGAAIFAGEPISWGHVVMNFVVPYLVSSYSAAKNQLRGADTGKKP